MGVAGALALTGAVVTVWCLIFGVWATGSRGVDRRDWHRPAVASLGVAAAGLLIAAIWVWVVTS
jgi:hypothetical protein